MAQATAITLSVIIPAYNEGTNVVIVLEDTLRTLDDTGLRDAYEIIVVNDGSTDDTGQLLDTFAQTHASVTVHHHPVNRGMGAAQQTALPHTTGAYVATIPADGEVRVDQVVRFLEEIGDADILVSDRVCNDADILQQVRPWYRGVLTWVSRRLLQLLLGFDPERMQGISLVRGEALRGMPLLSTSGMLHLEVILRCRRRRYTFVHSVMDIHPRISGSSKVTGPRSLARAFWDILKLRLALSREPQTPPG